MEKILLEIKKNKTVEGSALKPEEVGEYGKEIDRIIGLRRNYISMRPGVEKVLEIREGGNIEAKNPEFAKTEQGRIVQMMTNEDSYDIAETLLSEVNRQGVEYVNALQSIMNNLMDSGYSISRKYEQRLTDSEDKTVEEIRKAYQDKINKKNKAPADTRVEFPVFTINGTTFCTYGLEGMLDLLAGKDLKIEGENGEKAVELMGKYTELSKKSVVLFDLYGSESGMKHILFNYYKKKYTEELTGTRRELIPLLEGSVEGIEGYK